jgi:D-aspartate ligase
MMRRAEVHLTAHTNGLLVSELPLEKQFSGPLARKGQDAPVIIMNLFYTGVGIARDLAGRGLRIMGLSSHPQIYGNFTRFCTVRPAPNSQKEPEALLEFLLDASHEFRGAVIFPTRDFDVLFLDRYRLALEPHYRLALPPREALLRVLDKHALVCAARKAGVEVPRTSVLRSRDELPRVAEEVKFPCVVKPVRAYDWRQNDNWQAVGGRKAFLVRTREELDRGYESVRHAHPEALVQEWIPGDTGDLVILGAYVREDSQPLAWFTARKLVQSPDDFGTGCMVQSEDIPELLAPTLRLWRTLGYRGMAEVEYKRDSRTGTLSLIEMNGRHWDQHSLGRVSGINLSLTAYLDLTGHRLEPMRKPVARATWIAEDSLLFYALRGIYRREVRLHRLSRLVRGPRIYAIFSWTDPWPFIRYMFSFVLPAIVRQSFGKLRRRKGVS